MKRAFTLNEVLTVTVILVLVAAIAYPVFVEARISGNRTACISNLKQIGMALEMYRQNEGGIDAGSPASMGLPPDPAPLMRLMKILPESMQCRGNDPKGNSYHFRWLGVEESPGSLRSWQAYTRMFGSESVILFDPSHQATFPRSIRWETWTCIGLRLNGSVFMRTNRGFPLDNRWWHDQ